MIDATELVVRLVPPSHSVLLIGDELQAVAEALEARGCVCRGMGVEKMSDLDRVAAEASASSIVIVDGFGRLTDPVGALRTLGSRLQPDGMLVMVVDNAAHLSRRLEGLRGTPPATDGGVPERPYHLSTLRGCLAAAGLCLQDLLRVVHALDPTVDAEVRRLGLDELISQPEASTISFVVVAAPGDAGDRMGRTVTEYLQAELDDLAQQLANERRRTGDLGDRVTQLGSLVSTQASDLSLARCQVDELEARLAEREAALSERMRELDRKHVEQKHLLLDLAVKDDFVADLRAQLDVARADRDRAEHEVARLLEAWDRPLYDAAEWIDLRLARVRDQVERRRHRR